MKNYYFLKVLILSAFFSFSCSQNKKEAISSDILIYNGTIYDGSGDKPYVGSVAIKDDKIVYVGENTI